MPKGLYHIGTNRVRVLRAIVEMGGKKIDLNGDKSDWSAYHIESSNSTLIYGGGRTIAITGKKADIQKTKSGLEKKIGGELVKI